VTVIVTLIAYSVLGYVLTAGGDQNPLAIDKEAALPLPHLIAAINLVTVILLQLGYLSVKSRRITAHAVFMGSSFILIAAFLVLYVVKVATLGPEQYKGPELIRFFVYLPALIIHLGLSIASVPLVFYNALTGVVTRRAAGKTRHTRVGRLTYPAWTLSLILGLLVYLMLRLA